jgi:alpha-mannosidase
VFAVTVSPRDYVLPYEQFRFREQDVSALSGNRITRIHVLSHSHWDREWYLCLEQFCGSLIIDLDRLFEMLSDSSYNFHHFHMDGKFLMVGDYLEVTIAELNAQGKISLGPLYSQPNVFLSSAVKL